MSQPDDVRIAFEVGKQRLVCVGVGVRHVVALRPQAHALVRYLARRNAEAGNGGVLCSHEELIGAVWPDGNLSHSRNELAKLVLGIRRQLEPFGADGLLENARGLGYRLLTSDEPVVSANQSKLPTPATPFPGRERELAAVAALLKLEGLRLVSLVGPGRAAKARLALQAIAGATGL